MWLFKEDTCRTFMPSSVLLKMLLAQQQQSLMIFIHCIQEGKGDYCLFMKIFGKCGVGGRMGIMRLVSAYKMCYLLSRLFRHEAFSSMLGFVKMEDKKFWIMKVHLGNLLKLF